MTPSDISSEALQDNGYLAHSERAGCPFPQAETSQGCDGPPARVIDVVGAVVRDGDRMLMAQRPKGKTQAGLWEFPGGKIEPGETPAQALVRECREELAISVEDPQILASVVHRYPEKTVRLILMECRIARGDVPVPQEHQAVAWVTASDLATLPICPADRELLPTVVCPHG